MIATRLIMVLGVLIAHLAQAQVDVFLQLDQNQFLPGESIPVKVRVANHSGNPFHLGGDTPWLKITVEADNSFVVPHLADLPRTDRFELPASKMATREVDIAPCYEITRPGRYTLTASVTIDEWNQTHVSAPLSFDVIRGSKVWERVFGVPNSGREDGSPEVRKYMLQQANYLRRQLRLYARITDVAEEHTFKVVAIGPMISLSPPQAMLDNESRLHVLFQSGPRTSTYCVITPAGDVERRDPVEYGASRPRLTAAEDGSVTVRGGVHVPSTPEPSSAPSTGSEIKN